MSKKSRRRNKKILSALLLGGLGLAAANRGKGTGVSGSDKAKFTSDEAYTSPVKKKAAPVIADTKVSSVPVGKMRGTGSDEAAITGQNKRAAYAQSMRADLSEPTSINVDMAEGSPMIDNPYNSRKIRGRLINRAFKSGGRAKLKSGGKVKGCGKALRGFGRAMKGKK